MDPTKSDFNLIWLCYIHAKKWIAKSNTVLCSSEILITFLVFSSFLSCTKNHVKTPGFKASKFQVHNKYRAPLDSALAISTDKSTTWIYPSFFERSRRFERATTEQRPEFQNIIQKLWGPFFNPSVTRDWLPKFTTHKWPFYDHS